MQTRPSFTTLCTCAQRSSTELSEQSTHAESSNTRPFIPESLDDVGSKTDIPQNKVRAGVRGIVLENLDSQNFLVEMYDADLWLPGPNLHQQPQICILHQAGARAYFKRLKLDP